MKFFHISDLHIGRRVSGFSLLEDQKHILKEILRLAGEHRPDAVLIAGDLYDKSLPSAEAVETVDWFLTELTRQKLPVFAISGNHDSPERVAYGSKMLHQAGLYLSRVFDGKVEKVPFGEADIYLLPFVRPAMVRRYFPDTAIETTEQAVAAVLGATELDPVRPSILLMHQFFAGASTCESEEVSVGGTDAVGVDVVSGFDYVALGHLHGPQSMGGGRVRYCGSPLKYSFSEVNQKKAVSVVTIDENREVQVEELPLVPLRDMRKIAGPISELVKPEVARAANPEDYLHITLTDPEVVLDAVGWLREVYPNLMQLEFAANDRAQSMLPVLDLKAKTPMELFEDFYVRQNGEEMTADQLELAKGVWEE